MRKPCNRTNPTRQRRIRKLRKSERLRLLEMELLRSQFQIEYLTTAVNMLLDQGKVKAPDMDAGKWYKAKLDNK
jgi:hypothetical protein